MATDFVEVAPELNRQKQIDNADIGDVVAIARRLDLTYGLPEGALTRNIEQMRAIMDTQAHRARRRCREKKFTVENGHFITRANAMLIVVTLTRVE